MKILWITIESIYPPNSGGRLLVYKRLEYLSKKNDIYLFYTYDNIIEKKNTEEIKNYCQEVHSYYRNKYNLLAIIKSILVPFTVSSRNIKSMQKDIINCIKNNDIDLINIDTPQMCINLLNLCNQINIPIILNQQNIEWKAYRDISRSSKKVLYKILYGIDSYRLKAYEKYIYLKLKISLMTFVSISDLNYFKHTLFNSKIKMELAPIGAEDCAEYKYFNNSLKGNNNCQTILFVGKMSYLPNIAGIEWFIKNVFPKILTKIPNVKLYVVGKDPVKSILDFKSNNIIITGEVDSVNEYYNLANLVVIPLHHGGGVKVKLLEAMANNKKIVTTSKGIEGTSFVANKDMLVGDSDNDFALFCIDILLNENKYESMYNKLYINFKNNYTWEALGYKYQQLLTDIIKG